MNKKSKNEDIEVALLKFCREARNQKILLTGAVYNIKQTFLQKFLISMILHPQDLMNRMVLSP